MSWLGVNAIFEYFIDVWKLHEYVDNWHGVRPKHESGFYEGWKREADEWFELIVPVVQHNSGNEQLKNARTEVDEATKEIILEKMPFLYVMVWMHMLE